MAKKRNDAEFELVASEHTGLFLCRKKARCRSQEGESDPGDYAHSVSRMTLGCVRLTDRA